MNCWEYKYIQEFQRAGKLITEQQTYDFNPLLAITPKKKRSDRENQSHQYSTATTRQGRARSNINTKRNKYNR